MKVVLLTDIKDFGKKGETREAKPGYARNFLLPKGLVVFADSVKGQELVKIKESESEKQQEEKQKIANVVMTNQNLEFKFERKASSEGKLFGSVTIKEIKEVAEKKIGIKVAAFAPNHPVKEVGSHKYNLELDGQQTLGVTVVVSALVKTKK